MNIMELIESYFQREATEAQVRQLIDWLQKDKENIKNFIREANNYKNIRNFLTSKKTIFEKRIAGEDILRIIGEQKESSAELPFEELKQAAGGKTDTYHDSKNKSKLNKN